jgi:hypothetical protein
VSGTFFLSSPYTPKVTASASPIQGTVPSAMLITNTAAVATSSATHCARRSRSCSTSTPSSTLTSGLM